MRIFQKVKIDLRWPLWSTEPTISSCLKFVTGSLLLKAVCLRTLSTKGKQYNKNNILQPSQQNLVEENNVPHFTTTWPTEGGKQFNLASVKKIKRVKVKDGL